MKSSHCNYSDAYILVTEDAGNDTDVALKNFAPFSTCKTKINENFIDEENHIYIVMPM